MKGQNCTRSQFRCQKLVTAPCTHWCGFGHCQQEMCLAPKHWTRVAHGAACLVPLVMSPKHCYNNILHLEIWGGGALNTNRHIFFCIHNAFKRPQSNVEIKFFVNVSSSVCRSVRRTLVLIAHILIKHWCKYHYLRRLPSSDFDFRLEVLTAQAKLLTAPFVFKYEFPYRPEWPSSSLSQSLSTVL